MAHNTQGSLRGGRHPAMWQSVPIGSFILQPNSECTVSEENGEQPANNLKKNITGVKHFPVRKKDSRSFSSRNNGPMKNEDCENKSFCNKEIYQVEANLKPNSTQRQRGNYVLRHGNGAFFHSSPQRLSFLSSEDDFPSLSNAAGPKMLKATTPTHQIPQAATNVSYSEKLKRQIVQQREMENNEILAGKDGTVNEHKNLFSGNLSRSDKPDVKNRKYRSFTSVHAPNKSNEKFGLSTARNGSHSNQVNSNCLPKAENRNGRGNVQNFHLNARENRRTVEETHGKSHFLSKSQGSPSANGFDHGNRSTVSKTEAVNCINAENATADVMTEHPQPSKVLYRNKRPVNPEIGGNFFSPKQLAQCENVSNDSRSSERKGMKVKNNASGFSKGPHKHPATYDGERENASKLPVNPENVKSLQQETASKPTKKRKNRKSKIKRNLAFQTGKIMILTPELYSRFTGSQGTSSQRGMQNISFDLSDMEEYPELGQMNKSISEQSQIADFPSGSCMSEHTLRTVEITAVEDSGVSRTAASLVRLISAGSSAAASEQNVDKKTASIAVGPDETDKCNKPCCAPRKKVEHPDSILAPGDEKKEEPSSASEQRAKTRHDGSIQISFSDILSTVVKVKSEMKKNKKQNELKIKVISSKKIRMDKNLRVPPNALDSSRPVIKRGKEREKPKPKKHTRLKRIILKERSEKKERRLMMMTMISQGENKKNNSLCQIEDQDILPPDKEVKAESEIEGADGGSVLLNDIPAVELVSELSDGTEDETHDLDASVQAKKMQEPLCMQISGASDCLPQEKKIQAVQIAIHTCHFREYCNHLLSAEIDQVTRSLLGDLTRFQDRLHQKDPVKARVRRRLVYGIKEVTKHLKLKKVKFVILAPDSENIKSKGGLNDALTEVVRICTECHVPCVFALRRRTLGRACLKAVPVACVGVFNYDGSEANFKKLIELQTESKKAYDAVMMNLKELITEEHVEELLETRANCPESLQSLRINVLRELLLEKNPDLHLVFTPSGNVQLGHKEE